MDDQLMRSATLKIVAAALSLYMGVFSAVPAQAQLVGQLVAGEDQGAPGTQVNLAVDAAGRLQVIGSASGGNVYGNDPISSPPTQPPVFIGCRYVASPVAVSTGDIQQVLCDDDGRLETTATIALGSSVAATQSGTWTVQQGTPPWTVSDGGGSLTVDGPLTDTQLRATPVPVSGTVTATANVVAPVGALTDGSGSITTGGTSQQVFAANASRKYLFCQSPGANTETVFFNFGSAASTSSLNSYELTPGASLVFESNFIPSGTVNVVAATTGTDFICKQG